MRRRALLLAAAGALLAGGGVALRRSTPPLDNPARERAATPPGMVYVPGGEYWRGTDDTEADDDARPARRVFVAGFYIDRDEVTNAEFARFQPSHRFTPAEARLPATGITYDQAAAYAAWCGKRLPTEDEWEKAARGTDGRRYPWGNTWEKSRVAARAKRPNRLPCGAYSRVQPVGSVHGADSPYGCRDMAGNAWEWVQGHPDGRRDQRILRGGAVGYGERACLTYHRAIEGAGVT